MVESNILAKSIIVSKELLDKGAYIIVNPSNEAIMLLDILVTAQPKGKGNLILQIGDNEHRLELADINVSVNKTFHCSFTSMPKFWKGARFEALKSFNGKATIVVTYIKVSGADYSVWQKN